MQQDFFNRNEPCHIVLYCKIFEKASGSPHSKHGLPIKWNSQLRTEEL